MREGEGDLYVWCVRVSRLLYRSKANRARIGNADAGRVLDAGCNSGYSASSSGTSCIKAASSTTKPATPTTSTRPSGPTQPLATPQLRKTYSGSSFFDSWTFWTASDPTHGLISYLSRADALANKLVSISKAGTAIISIDRTSRLSEGQPRKSVRISSTDVYQPGNLVIVDLKHVPVGCSTWPAFWMCESSLSRSTSWCEGGRLPCNPSLACT